MPGLVLDLVLEFVFRLRVRFLRALGTRSWPSVRAQRAGPACGPSVRANARAVNHAPAA